MLGGVAGATTAAGVVFRVWHDHRAGISGNERDAKRDEHADWAAFAAEYRQALEAERAENARLRALVADLENRPD